MYEKYAGLVSKTLLIDDLSLQVKRDETGEFVSLSVDSNELDAGYTDVISSWHKTDDGVVVYMKNHVLNLSFQQTIGFKGLLEEVTPDLPTFICYKPTPKRLFSFKWLLK